MVVVVGGGGGGGGWGLGGGIWSMVTNVHTHIFHLYVVTPLRSGEQKKRGQNWTSFVLYILNKLLNTIFSYFLKLEQSIF